MGPPVDVFLTSIAAQVALRKKQDYILRTLQVHKIAYNPHDLSSNEDAKRLWKRKAPLDKQQLPGILVGGRFVGVFEDFEEAVECDDVKTFLRQNEEWDPDYEDKPLQSQPVGVAGAYTPQKMTNQKPSFSNTPSPLRKSDEKEIDAGEAFTGYGLQGVKVTEDELLALVEELGLEGDEAGSLAKNLQEQSGEVKGKKHPRAPPSEEKTSHDVE